MQKFDMEKDISEQISKYGIRIDLLNNNIDNSKIDLDVLKNNIKIYQSKIDVYNQVIEDLKIQLNKVKEAEKESEQIIK